MTLHTALKAVLCRPDTQAQRVVTLMLEQIHMVTTHEVGVLDTLARPLGWRQLRHIDTGLSQRQQAKQSADRKEHHTDSAFQ